MRGAGERMGEAVVQTLDPAQNSSGLGHVIEAELLADGSGRVRMDLSDVYRLRKKFKKKRFTSPYDRAGGAPSQEAFADELGSVAATRDVLIDYSGKAGVPMVMIVRDQLKGVESPVWSWPLGLNVVTRKGGDDSINNQAAYSRKPASSEGVSLTDRGFQIQKGEALLSGTFVQENLPELQVEEFSKRFDVPKNTQTRSYTCLTAEGGDEFLAVLTLDPKAAPEVKSKQTPEGLHISIGEAKYLVSSNSVGFLDR